MSSAESAHSMVGVKTLHNIECRKAPIIIAAKYILTVLFYLFYISIYLFIIIIIIIIIILQKK